MDKLSPHTKKDITINNIDIFNRKDPESPQGMKNRLASKSMHLLLNGNPKKNCHKQKVIATVHVIQGEITDKDIQYYLKIIHSEIQVIRFIITILNEKYFNYLRNSHELMKSLMKQNNVNIPILISVDYKILRMMNTQTLNLKKKETLFIKFNNEGIIEEDSLLYGKASNLNNFFFITNQENARSYNIEPGDKIIVDFGKGLFTVSKVVYKGGLLKEISETELESEMEFGMSSFSTQLFDNLNDFDDNTLKSSEALHKEIIEVVDKYYKHQKINTKTLYDEEENNVDYVEIKADHDCKITPRRPTQIYKKKQYDKFNYIPENIKEIIGRIIVELDIDYISVDHASEELYLYLNKKIKESGKIIHIISKISNLYVGSLRDIDLICDNSIGVLFAINYFCKELSFVDIVMMTENIFRLVKSKGKCVLVYSNLLESLLKQQKPTMSELVDIKSFVEMGVDGFVLGSETLDKLKCLDIVKSLFTILDDLTIYMPKSISSRGKIIGEKVDKIGWKEALTLSAKSIYNSLTKNPEINLVLISDDENVFTEFISKNFINDIIIVTNSHRIIKMFLVFTISSCLFFDEIENEEKLQNFLKTNDIIQIKCNSPNPVIFVSSLRGKEIEVFHLDINQ